MQDPDLDGIELISNSQSFIQSSRTSVEEEAGRLVNDGLTTRNQTRMAAGLQILYNMKQMEQKVDELLQNISDELTREIRRAVDMSSLQKEMRGNYGMYPSIGGSNLIMCFYTIQAHLLVLLFDVSTMNPLLPVSHSGHRQYGTGWKLSPRQ